MVSNLPVSNQKGGAADYMLLTFRTDQHARQVQWKVDIKLGGGQVDDEFYPYVQVCQPDENTLKQENRKYFRAWVEGQWSNWVHVKDLRAGDTIQVTPSFFDFQYLDSSVRRFEVGERRRHLILGEKGPRPYYLEEFTGLQRIWELANKNLKGQTQFKNILSLLEERITLWRDLDQEKKQDVLAAFVQDIIHEPQGVGQNLGEQDVKLLEKAFHLGWMFDVDELFRLIGGKTIKSKKGAEHDAEVSRHVA